MLATAPKGVPMGQPRETMDRLNEALTSNDVEALRSIYADDAEAVTPDQGRITGREAIVAYLTGFASAFPDGSLEFLQKHETADTAIDEVYFIGTNSGPIETPDGQSIPATGRQVRVRECDVATVRDGVITSHRFYFDQMDFLSQLGLAEPV
jgi:ketosteroid isomerase-like protein